MKVFEYISYLISFLSVLSAPLYVLWITTVVSPAGQIDYLGISFFTTIFSYLALLLIFFLVNFYTLSSLHIDRITNPVTAHDNEKQTSFFRLCARVGTALWVAIGLIGILESLIFGS